MRENFEILIATLAAVVLVHLVGMAFASDRVPAFVRNCGVWAWYLRKVFGYTHETLSSAIATRSVRLQGVIGLMATVFAVYA
jgi:hypothetical protein